MHTKNTHSCRTAAKHFKMNGGMKHFFKKNNSSELNEGNLNNIKRSSIWKFGLEVAASTVRFVQRKMLIYDLLKWKKILPGFILVSALPANC